jgi:23S rRNA pseudouridine1911/1915/1917 synthase
MTMTPPSDDDEELDYGVGAHLDEDGKPRIVERHLIVPPELAGLRLDHFVKTQITRLSRTKIQAIIETQLRRADGYAPKSATSVVAGEHYIIRREAKPEPPCPRTFGLVHEDPRMLIVDKPAGLPVHASAKFYFNTLVRVMLERFPDEKDLHLCHRLDRETSGVVVVARDREAASFIKQAIAAKHRTTKEYLAVVDGEPPWLGEVLLDAPLRVSNETDPTRVPTVKVLVDPINGLTSATRVIVEKRGRYSLVRCTLLTGRQHQIRVHLAHAGFPVVGDKLYAHGDDAFIEYCDEGMTPELAALFVLPRHALHAAKITVPHPDGGRVTGEAPLPADMAALLPLPVGVTGS